MKDNVINLVPPTLSEEALTSSEEAFILLVTHTLNEMRPNFDLDLFALLAHRLLKAGYTDEHMDKVLAIAKASIAA
jgi:hypothetical protein